MRYLAQQPLTGGSTRLTPARLVPVNRASFARPATIGIVVAVASTLVALGPARAGGASAATCIATHEQTEGPYYKSGAPKRGVIATPGTTGRVLIVSGRVRDASCKPVARAKLDFWQADGTGQYDNQGYRLRGYTFTDAGGRYRIETVYPGLYPGRTRHIHVKVAAPRGPILTTQLYFPGVPENASDAIFDPATVVKLNRSGRTWKATFDFVVRR